MTSEPFRYNSENLLLDIHDLGMGPAFCVSNGNLNNSTTGDSYYNLGIGSELRFSDNLNNKSLSNGSLFDTGNGTVAGDVQKMVVNSQSNVDIPGCSEGTVPSTYSGGSVNSNTDANQILSRRIIQGSTMNTYDSSKVQECDRNLVDMTHSDLYHVNGICGAGGSSNNTGMPAISTYDSTQYTEEDTDAQNAASNQLQPILYPIGGYGVSSFLPVNSNGTPKQSSYISAASPPSPTTMANNSSHSTSATHSSMQIPPHNVYNICRGYSTPSSFPDRVYSSSNFKRIAASGEKESGSEHENSLSEPVVHNQQSVENVPSPTVMPVSFDGTKSIYNSSAVISPERKDMYYAVGLRGTPNGKKAGGKAPLTCESMSPLLAPEGAVSDQMFYASPPNNRSNNVAMHMPQGFGAQAATGPFKESSLQQYLRIEEKAEATSTNTQNAKSADLDNFLEDAYLGEDYFEHRKSKKLNPLTYEALFSCVIENAKGIREKYVRSDHPKVHSLSELPGMIYFLFVSRGTRKPPHVGYPFRSYTDSHYTSVDRDTPIICKVKERPSSVDLKNVWRLYHYYLGNKKRTPRKRKRTVTPDDDD